jgi:phospholipase C
MKIPGQMRLMDISIIGLLLVTACGYTPVKDTPSNTPAVQSPTSPPTRLPEKTSTEISVTQLSVAVIPTITPVPARLVPQFDHIIVIVFENKEFTTVIGNPQMPAYNRWAKDFTLLSGHFAVVHPSLPNYFALTGGDTFGVDTNYPKKLIDAVTLPDLLEASGRNWKTYQDSMERACQTEDTLLYVKKHNPFIYYRSIVENKTRCIEHIVPLAELEKDLQEGNLPNYVFITPNLCNSAHDAYTDPQNCGLEVADRWLGHWLNILWVNPQVAGNGLIIVTWDEGQGDHGCCGMQTGGGRVPTILISSKAKKGFTDDTPYTHYSILKTIAAAWDLPLPGKAAEPQNALIVAPWLK